MLTCSYVGSRYEYDVRLGNQVVQVLEPRSGLAGEAVLVFEPAQALLYPEKVELSDEERDLLTVYPPDRLPASAHERPPP